MRIFGPRFRVIPRQPACEAAACGLLALLSLPALAVPLDKNACAKLAQDMQNMKTLGADKLMERGPAWAVSHLSPSDLSLIRHYIDLDEQMKFRCSAAGSLVHLKHLDDEDEEGGQNGPKASADSDAKKVQNGDGAGRKAVLEKRGAVQAPEKRTRARRKDAGLP